MSRTPFPFLLTVGLEIISAIHQLILSNDSVQNIHTSIERTLRAACKCPPFNCKCLEGYHEWIRKNSAEPPEAVVLAFDTQLCALLYNLIDENKWEQISSMLEYLNEKPEIKQLAEDWLSTVTNADKLLESSFAKAKTTLISFLSAQELGEYFRNMVLGTVSAYSPAADVDPIGHQASSSGLSNYPHKPIERAPSSLSSSTSRKTTYSLGNSDSQDVINILFLGERGTGKTALLNSIANYVKYETLDEALEEPILLDRALAEDEHPKKTQEPLIHCIPLTEGGSQKLLRLIDTPGFNDTAIQDQGNIDRIISLVVEVGTLNAICIVLKPNEKKLSQEFKAALDDIFAKLNSEVIRNTLFCFTNTKPTSYTHGKTMEPLAAYFKRLEKTTGVLVIPKKHNTFCFDNDCFLYMCKVMRKPSIAKSKTTHKEFSKGWAHNSQEYRRLLTKVRNREAVRVEDTVSIDKAQRFLAGVAELLTNVALNNVINEKNTEVRELKERQQFLAAVMEQKQPVARRKPLPKPQTICTNSTCSEAIRHSDEQIGYFPKIACHNEYVMELPPTTTQNMALTLDNVEGRCRDCGCSWKKHMNIDYELEETMESVATPEQREQFKNIKGDIQKAEMVLDEFGKKLHQLREEYALIKNISVEFSTSFGYYSLKPRTDPCLVHLNNVIEKETDPAQQKEYKELLEDYRYAVSVSLKKIKERKRKPLNPTQVGETLQKLSKLEISGAWISALAVEYNTVPVEQDRDRCWTIHSIAQQVTSAPAQSESDHFLVPKNETNTTRIYPALNQ